MDFLANPIALYMDFLVFILTANLCTYNSPIGKWEEREAGAPAWDPTAGRVRAESEGRSAWQHAQALRQDAPEQVTTIQQSH